VGVVNRGRQDWKPNIGGIQARRRESDDRKKVTLGRKGKLVQKPEKGGRKPNGLPNHVTEK